MQLQERVALITGAGSGIGRAAAIRLAQEGAKIGALGRDRDELEAVVREIQAQGRGAIALAADISQAKEMKQAIDQLGQRWGRIDIVFANAGINGVWARLEELSPEEWDKTLNINLRGTFLTIKYAVPYLKKQGGSIIVTSSVNGTRMFSNTGASAYATSKAGQVAFTKMIALELAQDKVRANVICPGAIETEIDQNTERRHLEQVQEPVEFPEGKVPLTDGKPGRSEQVAELVLFLASDASSHISGTEIWIDGAQSLLQG
ncbi:MAG TPA: SDR family NAD(P)-dependent oxidoreductase [Aggregatilineaceae bacterium]|nr:SDR family NAD(P)-dependent oxidoreductase [Aggregatilineaceae bacterium]